MFMLFWFRFLSRVTEALGVVLYKHVYKYIFLNFLAEEALGD